MSRAVAQQSPASHAQVDGRDTSLAHRDGPLRGGAGLLAVQPSVTRTPRRPAASRWEVSLLVGISTLLHLGAVAKAFQGSDVKPTLKRASRVEIEMVRPPPPTPPVVPPPPAPAKVEPKPEPKPLPKAQEPRPQPVAPTPELRPEVPPEVPVDTGSSASADAEGTLHAGSGGLGLAPAEPERPSAPVAAPPAPVVAAREGANYLNNPRPSYPGRARREGWEGTTLLRVQVTPKGRPAAIRVQRSSGRELLDEAAREAVEQWTFVPATQGGEAISGWVTVPIVFELQ